MEKMNFDVLNYFPHIIARIHNISLRIMHEDAIERICSKLIDDSKEKNDLSTDIKTKFIHLLSRNKIEELSCETQQDSELSYITKAIKKIDSKEMWRTLPSNPNPYYRRIAQNMEIKARSNLCLLNTIYLHAKDMKKREIFFVKGVSGLDKFILYLPQVKGYLVGGYVRDGKKASMDNHIGKILNLQEVYKSDRNTIFFTEYELKLLLEQRKPVSIDRLEDKAKKIRNIYDVLSQLSKTEKSMFNELKRDELRTLIESASFFSDKNIQDTLIERFFPPVEANRSNFNNPLWLSICHQISQIFF